MVVTWWIVAFLHSNVQRLSCGHEMAYLLMCCNNVKPIVLPLLIKKNLMYDMLMLNKQNTSYVLAYIYWTKSKKVFDYICFNVFTENNVITFDTSID